MTYAQARLLGIECGLSEPAEFVNNIHLHALNLFVYAEVKAEINELTATARAAGVRYSRVCKDAILDGDPEDELCYICRKIADVSERAERKTE